MHIMTDKQVSKGKPKVAVVMGSESDWSVMRKVTEVFDDFFFFFESKISSAHRTPDLMSDFSKNARNNGYQYIIAGAGGAAHLPGMIASNTTLPVIGVPIPTTHLEGTDSLLSIVQMPKGIPVATFAIGEPGAVNAALYVISLLAIHDSNMEKKLAKYRENQTSKVLKMKLDK